MLNSHDAPVPRGDAAVRPALEAALRYARTKVPYADALYERVFKCEVHQLASGQRMVKPASVKGAVQIRLVGEGGRQVGVKAGDAAIETLRAAIDRGMDALAAEPADPGFGLAPIPNPSRERYGVAPTDDPRDVDPTPRLEALARAVDALAAEGSTESVRVVPELWAWEQVEEKWVADTDGIFKTQVMTIGFVQVVFRAVRGELQARTRVRFGEVGGLSQYIDAAGSFAPEVARELAAERDVAVRLLDARTMTADELSNLTHYVLHKSALVFIHEGLGHPIEADIVRSGNSAIVAPGGEARVSPLGSSVVRIVDGSAPDGDGNPVADRGFGTEFIDDEGVEVRSAELVSGGHIVGMMHSRETAWRYGVAPTGNGFSELGDRRIVRMRNTVLCPERGDHWVESLGELLRGVELGVVLHGSLGGAVSKEGMSSSTQYGYLVRDGKLTGEIIAPGNFTALTAGCLKSVDGYAGPVDSHGVGFCGKGSQLRRVTEGGPTFVRLGASPWVNLTFEG
ncbi:MAG: TldD/PmbA family protein [Deltaproteobacteria bacterium]|nr:TldD/PmbA family protein [Deltaproteobacteria bacterium]